MSDPTAQEPTMEEILASIRRIISEDDAPAADAGAPTAKAGPAPSPVHLVAPPAEEDEDDEVLDLTEPAPAAAPPAPAPARKETHGDLDVFEPAPPSLPEPKLEPKPEPKIEPKPPEASLPETRPPEARPPEARAPERPAPPAPPALDAEDDRLISGGAEGLAASHFGKLAQTLAMPATGRNLEDLVAELLKPLLKDWLDQHLPAIVEEKVQSEVERIARRRV